MVTFGRSMYCTDAEPYYYDFLCGLDAGIPHAVADHIRHCARCRAQIRQLEAAIAESEAQDRTPEGGADVVGTLGLHFAHLGEDITCAKARSFLPILLVPSLEIRIPTPITVHVDHCRSCAEDLEKLRELELRPEQLARLSRLYAAIPGGDPQMCRRTRAKTWAFACASFEGIDAQTLNHMCVCPRCRRRVYRCREKILAGRQPGDTIPGVGLCGGISMADLFEWVVPYDRAGGSPEQVFEGDETIPSHLQACPECIERMQALHRTIYSIAERVDSGVSTVYTTDGEAANNGGQMESLYKSYPIHVEVAHREPEPAATRLRAIAHVGTAVQRMMASPQFRPVMRAGLMAAAMIPLAILLLVNTRSASGLSIPKLDEDVRRVENIHVLSYERDVTEAVQEIWVSHAGRWAIRKDAHQQSLTDLERREQRAGPPGGGASEIVSLTRDEAVGLERRINESIGSVRSAIPAGREYVLVTQEPVRDVQDGNETFDWIWERKSDVGPSQLYMLRVFVDPTTKRLNKAEYSQKMSNQDQWERYTTRVFEYLSQEEMDLDRKGMFGDR